jgi:glycosyltransferase involved in cell wall biosynthesis
MKKVCVFFPTIEAGGMERALAGIASGLLEIGYDVVLFHSSCKEATRAILPGGLRLFPVATPPAMRIVNRKVWEVANLIPAWVAFLRKEKPDCVLSFQSSAVAIPFARAIGIPIIHRESSDCLAALAAQRNPVLKALVWTGKVSMYRLCHSVIANSRRSAKSLSRMTRIPESRIGLIYNPVDAKAIRARSAEAPDPDAWFAGNAPIVIGVGRLSREKNFAGLIRSFKIARDSIDCRLVIIGEGGERAALEALIADLDLAASVKLPGYRANPYAYLSRAAVFALSSRFEGLPNVMLEAVALEVPVASMDCPSGPREILSEGAGGMLVPPDDETALGAAILKLLENPGLAKGLAGRASKDADRFDPIRIARQYGDLIERACGSMSR